MGLTLLNILGFEFDFSKIGLIQSRNFTEIGKLIKKEYNNFFTFIQYFMLPEIVENRYSIIRLR